MARESGGAFPVGGPSCQPGEGPRGDDIQITRRKASLADALKRSRLFNGGENEIPPLARTLYVVSGEGESLDATRHATDSPSWEIQLTVSRDCNTD